ncbi:MAG: hypothetical protein JJU36_15480 [Phycisphaeraceae bacterium]|nr:hypothetical protein [Phycisphaeraceae bacterium]
MDAFFPRFRFRGFLFLAGPALVLACLMILPLARSSVSGALDASPGWMLASLAASEWQPPEQPSPHARITWEQLTPETRPQARSGHAMAYDSKRQRIVLFGGGSLDWSEQGPVLDDTWEWDGENWSLSEALGTRPSARTGHTMVYDAGREAILLFGGRDEEGRLLGDMWSYDGRQWRQLRIPQTPSARDQATMVFDPAREQVTLFGGREGPLRASSETHVLMERSWGRRPVITSPPGRYGHGMAWDDHRRVGVLFGGTRGGFPALNDTWEWNGVSWQQATVEQSPPAARGISMVYDPGAQRVLMFGGRLVDPDQRGFLGLWSWNGATWHQFDERRRPLDRAYAAMALDTARNQIILFGGMTRDNHLADTWAIDLPAPRGR